jgi:hypothetical protein
LTRKLSKADRDTITRLVESYSAKAVADAAMAAMRPPKKAGRHPNHEYNLVAVWACVEYRRTKSASKRITRAVNGVAKDLARWTVNSRPAAGTLRRWHWEAEQKRATDPDFRDSTDRALANLLTKSGPGFPLLLKRVPGGLEGPIIDRLGRGGRE